MLSAPTSQAANIGAGAVAVSGPDGVVQRIHVSSMDSPESIEHCLRAVFRIPRGASLVLYNRDGLAMPLGTGLLSHVGADGSGAGGPVYKIKVSDLAQSRVVADSTSTHTPLGSIYGSLCTEKNMPTTLANTLKTDSNAAWDEVDFSYASKACTAADDVQPNSVRVDLPLAVVPSEHDAGPARICFSQSYASLDDCSVIGDDEDAAVVDETAREELRFWCDAAVGFNSGSGRNSLSKHRFSKAGECVLRSMFDSSDQRIETIYSHWTRKRILTKASLRHKLEVQHGCKFKTDQFQEAMRRVYACFGSMREQAEEEDKLGEDAPISRLHFGALWQRLMLGAVYRWSLQHGHDENASTVQLIEYSDNTFELEHLCEEDLLFRCPLCIRSRRRRSSPTGVDMGNIARWVRSNTASPEMLCRLGVKFFLHPLATGDSASAAKVGMTKIDRYRHQYFASLEVYALKEPNLLVTPSCWHVDHNSEPLVPGVVAQNVVRSSLFVVATGSPSVGHRNWLLSVVGESQAINNPLDFFKSDPAGAIRMLDDVQDDLQSHGRLREYQADFLLYTLINKSALEITPVCLAYGHRLRYLQNRLDTEKLSLPAEHVDEVLKVRLELQELRQWVGQTKGILKTLAEDCRTYHGQGEGWSFGAHAEGKGKSLLLFLSGTDAHLEQTADRLATLDDLARNFAEHHERHRNNFLNNILLTLTIATAVFMPAQLMAGIYGMNFVDDEGVPTIPELRWEFGYYYFLLAALGMIVAGLVLACVCIRR